MKMLGIVYKNTSRTTLMQLYWSTFFFHFWGVWSNFPTTFSFSNSVWRDSKHISWHISWYFFYPRYRLMHVQCKVFMRKIWSVMFLVQTAEKRNGKIFTICLKSYYSITVVRSCQNIGISWLKYVYVVCKFFLTSNWTNNKKEIY